MAWGESGSLLSVRLPREMMIRIWAWRYAPDGIEARFHDHLQYFDVLLRVCNRCLNFFSFRSPGVELLHLRNIWILVCFNNNRLAVKSVKFFLLEQFDRKTFYIRRFILYTDSLCSAINLDVSIEAWNFVFDTLVAHRKAGELE